MSGTLPERPALTVDADTLARMGALLARVPEPLADLDHVPATAATVLERVRYLHEHYELERCRVLLLGDHDATSLAFAVLGVRAARAGRRRRRPAPAQLPCRRGRRHVVRRPARRPARAAARALRPRPHRPAVLAGRRRAVRGARRRGAEQRAPGPPAGRLRLSRGLARARAQGPVASCRALELVYEAVLPDFNAYDGALAIGSRAALYVLRPTKRSRKIAVRRAGRHAEAMYTRGRQAIESGAAAAPDLAELRGRAGRAVLRRGLGQARTAAQRPARCPATGGDGRRQPRPGPRLQPLSGGGRGGRAASADRRPQPHRRAAHRGRAGAVARASSRRATRSSRSRARGGTRRSRSSSCAAKARPRDERLLYREATATSIARADSGAPQSSSDAGVATL